VPVPGNGRKRRKTACIPSANFPIWRMFRHAACAIMMQWGCCAPRIWVKTDTAIIQAANCRRWQIETLKSYGFTLAEVKELLLLPETELAHRIHVRRISTYAQLNEMRRVIRRMEAAIVQMEGTSMANDTYHVILMQAPAQKVFSVRRTIQIGEMHDLFAELRAQMKRAGVRRTGPTQARYHGEEFSYEHMDVEAQAAVDADGPNVSVIPAGTFAAVTHTGPYENIKYAYDALCGWVAHHPEYKVCGPAIERYIKDEAMVHDPEELETGVLFPVCRAEE